MTHEFSLIWRIIIHLSNLTHFPLVVPIFIRTKNRTQGLYVGKLFGWLVVLLELHRMINTILTLFSCFEVARVKHEVLVST